jgi:hypothetical protein
LARHSYLQTGVHRPTSLIITNRSGVFQQVAYFRWSGFNITEGAMPESVEGVTISAGLLPQFGVGRS